MKLIWTTTASVILQEDNTTIAFDPFCSLYCETKVRRRTSALPGTSLTRDADRTADDPISPTRMKRRQLANFAQRRRQHVGLYRQASHVFVTHGHFDHIMHIPQLYKAAPSVMIHATETPCATLAAKGIPANLLHRIRPGDTVQADPFTVTAFPSRHCRFDLRLVLQTLRRTLRTRQMHRLLHLLILNQRYRENGETLFYEVSCRGRRIQIMGSLNLEPDISYPTGADLLVLPYQGKSHLAPYAAQLLDRLRPKAVLIDHHDDSFPPMTAPIDPGDLVRQLDIPVFYGKAESESQDSLFYIWEV